MDVDCSKKGWLAFALSSDESVKKNPGEIAHSIITEVWRPEFIPRTQGKERTNSKKYLFSYWLGSANKS